MASLQSLYKTFGSIDCRNIGANQMDQLRSGLKNICAEEVSSANDGKMYIRLLRTFRETVAEYDKFHGENYPQLLNSLLSVGEDGLYSNSLRFIFELIQNVDDCDFTDSKNCSLDMHFDFNSDTITLKYNEVGFSPFNVFAITGIAEKAKNISAAKNEIGEKGIGFKSVFGVADKVLIQSGWFSFELYKKNFTIPVEHYISDDYVDGTIMTLYVPRKAKSIYLQIRDQYCRKDALFSKNPLLFLNKLTSLKMYFDDWRSMEFRVSRKPSPELNSIHRDDDVMISIDLHDHDSSRPYFNEKKEIRCTRYVYPVTFSRKACQSRYGSDTAVGSYNGKTMYLQVVFPHPEHIQEVGNGSLYSFLPTQLSMNVPMVCHVPFKLDASREFVDPQDNNLWFQESVKYLSDIIDYAYKDWCRIVRNDIIQYLPGQNESIVAKNNGKEKCLSKIKELLGSHFLKLPLFITLSREYVTADDIFYFLPEENIKDPQRVYELVGYSKALFIPPTGFNMHKYGIAVEKNIYNTVFNKALSCENITGKALNYLDEVSYEYNKKYFPTEKSLSFSVQQIEEIMQHENLALLLQNISVDCVKKKERPKFSVTGAKLLEAKEVIYSDFELSETPKAVEQYMMYCKAKCVRANISDAQFLVCYNAVVLSDSNPLSSFAAFCFEIDQKGTFAIRIRLKQASTDLDKCINDDSGTASDYLSDLRNIRKTVKDSLGDNGYRSYINLILKSGTDRKRFVQEILQNADDCDYPADVEPTFKLSRKGNTFITEYNEVGFTRSNIRSITAIGESTKNKLLSGDFYSIGKKGVGFKTIFAVASEVKISSGDYHFSLTDKEPTIPSSIKSNEKTTVGTKMEVTLKDKTALSSFDEKNILELCLCLRKLKRLDIDGHIVTIFDSEKDDKRVIAIDNKQHSFKKFVRRFEIDDETAIAERENGKRAVSTTQEIVCYVPERNELQTSFLYVGLPTRHKVQIPMIIDAPFELTTSREEIETDCTAWNGIIRNEMYNAIIDVINFLKTDERINVLRFARFKFELRGRERGYANDITDCEYLNQYDYLKRLRSSQIIPTYDNSIFAAMVYGNIYRYPDVATFIFDMLSPGEFENIRPASVIDTRADNISKEQGDRIETVLNALGCATAEFSRVFPVLRKYAEFFVTESDFRTKLYEYLQETPEDYKAPLRQLKIIPVYSLNGGNEYISWKSDSIFVKPGVTCSSSNYYVLNENILSKTYCERMLGVNINEMNSEWEHGRYNANLRTLLNSKNFEKLYSFLLQEFKNGNLIKNDSLGVLLDMRNQIPLKNQLNQIKISQLFSCDQPDGYFQTNLLKEIMVHAECVEFAKYLRIEELSGIHYEDIPYDDILTADEVEEIQDDYFNNSDEILRGFYNDGLLPDKLLDEYNLKYLSMKRNSDDDMLYDFPESCVINKEMLANHVRKQFANPIKIVSVKVERTVQKGQDKTGQTFELGRDDVRNGVFNIYSPKGIHGKCFCQMCHSVKPNDWIEVNNIQTKPQYFFPQLRISLCLECSKKFEALRANTSKRTEFINEIKAADISYLGKVDIPIGDETITFTGKHLAEIQEILKRLTETDG